MDEHGTGPKVPTQLSIKLPPDVAELLHRLAYETGRSKRDLVITAVRQAYGSPPRSTDEEEADGH
jgi:predicted transcriptional regulator